MADVTQLNDQHSSDWTFTVAELNSTRAIVPVDIINIISDFEVYEHIDKPYLTGKVIITDTQRVYERFDFQGGETFTVQIQRSKDETIKPIKKTFIVDEVLSIGRANETAQAIVLHLTEDIAFKDVLNNVNKFYKGQPQEIIETIAKDFLKKDVVNNAEENVESTMNVIVPNLSPIAAMSWIKNRATTKDGYPFFLFSSFALNHLMFYDLGTILSQTPINSENPFIYGQGVGTSSGPSRLFTIHDYKIKNVEDMSFIINKGYVGGKHSFYDVTQGKKADIHFDIHNDLYKNGSKLNKRQTNPLISAGLKYDDKSLTEYQSRSIHNVYASKTFDQNNALTENSRIGDHKRRVVANAMKLLLTKSPMEITVNGREFIDGSANYAVGNNITVVFKAAQDDNPGTNIDKKLSGDYLIHSARHVFSKEKCYSILLISKIANYTSDDFPVG